MADQAQFNALLDNLKDNVDSAIQRALNDVLASGDTSALGGVIRYYHLLSEEMRCEIDANASLFHSILPTLLKEGDEQSRINSIEFVRRTKLDSFASLLGDCLTDTKPEIAARAVVAINQAVGGFLESITDEKIEDTPASILACRKASDAIKSEDASHGKVVGLLNALGAAVECLDIHKRSEVIDNLVRLGKRGDAVLMTEMKQRLGRLSEDRPLIQQLTQTPCAASVVLLFSLMESGSTSLRRVAGDALKQCQKGAGHELLINTLKIMGVQTTRRVVRLTKSVPWMKECAGRLDELPAKMILGWVEELDELEIDLGRKLNWLRQCLECHEEAVATRIFQVFSKHYGPLIRPMLVELSDHEFEPVRYLATRLLSRSDYDGKLTLLKGKLSSNGESARIRSLAVHALAADQFQRFVHTFDQLSEEARRKTASMVRRVDQTMVRNMRPALESKVADQRLRALKILRYTGVTEELESAIISLASDADRKVRAAVAPLLAELKSPDSARAALELLGDKDVRVRSNAIEAVESFGYSVFQKALMPLLASKDGRERANAAKAMYKLGSHRALQILDAMARLPNFRQRISAVWALSHIRQRETLDKALEIAKYEADQVVQKRMLAIVDKVEEELREAELAENATAHGLRVVA